MRRRELVGLIGAAAAAWPIAARAQLTQSVPKIGWLKIQGRQHTPDQLGAFREGMRTLGMIEGRDFVLEERYGEGDEARLPSLAADLIASKV
jgi:putative ABC transport system substrate-binding protein